MPVIYLQDSYWNPDQFPSSFFKGAWEGFWWAFVSMTTVGYACSWRIHSIPVFECSINFLSHWLHSLLFFYYLCLVFSYAAVIHSYLNSIRFIIHQNITLQAVIFTDTVIVHQDPSLQEYLRSFGFSSDWSSFQSLQLQSRPPSQHCHWAMTLAFMERRLANSLFTYHT